MHKYIYFPLAAIGLYLLIRYPTSAKVNNWFEEAKAAGTFSHGDGPPLRTSYTGIPLIDKQLMFLVSFFMAFADGSNPDSRVFAIYFMLAGLMPNLVIWEIEGLRGGSERGIRYTYIWNSIMQVIGVCVIAPIFFLVHRNHSHHGFDAASVTVPSHLAAAVLPSMVLAYIIPSVAMFLPGTLIDPLTRQAVIAVWQIFPVLFSVIFSGFARILPRGGSDHKHLDRVYNACIAMGLAANVYVWAYILCSPAPLARAKAVFVPNLSPESLSDTAFLYLQGDFAVGVVASMVWSAHQVWGCVHDKSLASAVKLGTGLVAASVVLSPAVVMSAMFKWREQKLREGEGKEGEKKKL